MGDAAVIAAMWRRRRSTGGARNRAQTPADRCTYTSAVPAPGDCADQGSGAGADQTAGHGSIREIVGIRPGRPRKPVRARKSNPSTAGCSKRLASPRISRANDGTAWFIA